MRLMICRLCDRFLFASDFRCIAFPSGIPQEIINGENSHRSPVEGDHGLQFKPIDESAARMARRTNP